MTYPQQPQYAPQQPAFQNPQQLPPAQFQQPQYAPQQLPPAQFQPAPQQFQQQQQYAPQQQFPQQFQQQAPVPARGTLEDFMDQPTGGGTAITKFFGTRAQGSWLQLQVTRDILDTDVQFQTDNNGNIQYFKLPGGQPDYTRPKFVLVLKCTVLQSSDGSHPQVFQDGAAAVWIKGVTRDAFVAAMGAAGVPGADRALGQGKLGGAVFTMQSAGERANRGNLNPTKLYNFSYTPNGREHLADAPQAAPPVDPTPPAPVPTAAYTPPPAPAVPSAPAQTLPPGYNPQQTLPPGAYNVEQAQAQYAVQQLPQAPPVAPSPFPQAAPVTSAVPTAPPVQGAPQLSPERLAVLAQLQGQQQQ